MDVSALTHALAACSVRADRRVDLWTIVNATYATGGDTFAALVGLSPCLQDCREAAREYKAVLRGVACAMNAAAPDVTPEDVTAAVMWRGREFCAEFLHNPFMLYAADVRMYPGKSGSVARALAEFSYTCFGEDVMTC